MNRFLGSVALGAVLFWTQAAYAQSAAVTVPNATTGGQIQEIVVTASRRSENLQRTALPLTAITGDELAKSGVTHAEDLARDVAGLQMSGSGTATMVFLRGVGTFAQPYSDASILTSIDGIVAGLTPMLAGAYYDIRRVEVLKGPQGTLYGRNATGGAINIISNAPTDQFGGYAQIEVGNYSLIKAEAAVNVPVSDKLSVRASGQVVSRDGYFTDGSGDAHSKSVRIQALYKPTTDVSLLLGGNYVYSRENPDAYVPVPFVNPSNPWTGPSTTEGNATLAALAVTGNGTSVAPGTPIPLITSKGYSNIDSWEVHAELNWHLGFATLTAIPAYRHMVVSELIQPGFPIADSFTAHQTTMEVRLASAAGWRLKWLIGGFYFDLDDHGPTSVKNGTSVQMTYQENGSKAYAGFGDLTYSLTNSFRLTGGIRYTSETRTKYVNSSLSLFVQQGPTGPIYTPPASFTAVDSATFGNTTGKAGIEYDVAPGSLLYATFSTGFRAGGFNNDIAPNVYKPEKLASYTIGSKNRFFDNRLQANLELFYWDYTNKQENVLGVRNAGGFAVLTRNIGSAIDKGVSADFKYLLTKSDTFSAQIEYLNTNYKDFNYVSPLPLAAVAPTTNCATTRIAPAVAPPPYLPLAVTGTTMVNCSGKPFIRAPKWTALVGYQHVFALADSAQIIASANVKFASASYIATDYIPSERQTDYALVDLNLGYKSSKGRWSATAFVRNLGNVAVLTSGFEHPYVNGLTYSTLGAPRTYGVNVRYDF